MSIFAGIFSRDGPSSIDDAACEDLSRAVSRDARDQLVTFRDRSVFLAKVDIGAFGAEGTHFGADGSCSMLTGAPLLRNESPEPNREHDLRSIHSSLAKGDTDILRRVRGSFALAYYSPRSPTLILATDKVGLRTVYFWETRHYVFFATALRILEACSHVPKKMDLRGVTEIAVFGYPLGDRTAYSDIRAFRAGEFVQFRSNGTERCQYWRWDEVATGVASEEELLRETHERFTTAVKARLAGDTVTRSALTGGMDSRSVVGMLRHLDVLVHTFTFMPPASQEQVFASTIAHSLGTFHTAIEEARQDRWVSLSKKTWEESKARLRWPPERPMILWGGDGGSLLLGHIYLDRDLVDLLRGGKTDAAIDKYLRRYCDTLASRLLKREIYARLKDIAVMGVREELADLRTADPLQAFYLFLILNDQRRHLTGHFENVDVNRWELQAPFFDSDLMTSIISGPRGLYLYHQFYHKWWALFPAVLTSVPWQTYRGHLPCPLPVPDSLDSQWGRKRSAGVNAQSTGSIRKRSADWRVIAKEAKSERLSRARVMAMDSAFTRALIRKPYFAVATWVYKTGLRNYGYVFDQAQTYYEYWLKCHGKLASEEWTTTSAT